MKNETGRVNYHIHFMELVDPDTFNFILGVMEGKKYKYINHAKKYLLDSNWYATFRDGFDTCATQKKRKRLLCKFKCIPVLQILAFVPTRSYNPYIDYVNCILSIPNHQLIEMSHPSYMYSTLDVVKYGIRYSGRRFDFDTTTLFDSVSYNDPDMAVMLDQSRIETMLHIVNMFFTPSRMAMLIQRGKELAGLYLTESIFKHLLPLYVEVINDTGYDFSKHNKKTLIRLAFIAECMNDTKHVIRIINYIFSMWYGPLFRLHTL
jgi:hypothetical protein